MTTVATPTPLQEFALKIETEFWANEDALLAEFPSEMENEKGGLEPCLDWGEYIYVKLQDANPGLAENKLDEMVEEVRDFIGV